MKSIRRDFPILTKTNTVYLDSAASALTPEPVINKITEYYRDYSANVFRGLYPLSAKATDEYEKARELVAGFINAPSSEEVVFVRNATEAINLVAYAWGRMSITDRDEIVTTVMEHHSNFVPWQELTRETGASLKIIDIDDEGYLNIKKRKSTVLLKSIVTKNTKLLAITHTSNVLGTINPVKQIMKEVKRLNPNCLVLVDGAQAVPHMSVDVEGLGCDFYVFSGHKMMGPTGIGVLWGKKKLLDDMSPFMFGGSMIESVSLASSKYAPVPQKFEAGTPHIAGAIGMGATVEYCKKIGMETIIKHEQELGKYLLESLDKFGNITVYGPKDMKKKAGVVAFNVYSKNGQLIHPHDVGDILGSKNVCVRAGHHCAMPLAQNLGIPASVRASLHVYNNEEDIDALVKGLEEVKKIFS